MNTTRVFAVFALLCSGANVQVAAAVFRDHIGGGGGGRAHGADLEKEPVPDYLRSVVDCKLGEPHRNYPECRCGERVEIVPEKGIPRENLGDYHVRTKQTRRGTKNIFYHCLFCSQCPDGVRTLSNCSRMADTQCTTSCMKPTDYFDKGRKACVPDPRYQEATTKKVDVTTVNGLPLRRERTNGPSPSQRSDNPIPPGSSGRSPLLLTNDTYLLIVGWALVAAVVVVLVVNIFICRYFFLRRNHDQEKQRMLPETTSTASVSEGVHV